MKKAAENEPVKDDLQVVELRAELEQSKLTVDELRKAAADVKSLDTKE